MAGAGAGALVASRQCLTICGTSLQVTSALAVQSRRSSPLSRLQTRRWSTQAVAAAAVVYLAAVWCCAGVQLQASASSSSPAVTVIVTVVRR